MKDFKKKFIAALTAVFMGATMVSCTPTIGSASAYPLEIDGYKVRAGIFIFYTLSAYYEANDIVTQNSGSTAAATPEEVEKSSIDNLESKEWIQDKATEYCSDFVAIQKEFDKIGGTISEEDLQTVEDNVETYSTVEIYSENGIGEDSIRDILQAEYKRDAIFDYYYGFEGEKGMSEDELKDYFDDNFARVKYVKLSLLDSDGNELEDSDRRDIEKMADDYADRVNDESDILDKLAEMDKVQEEYDDYVEEKTAELEAEKLEQSSITTTTTTTTSNTETTTSTTADPHQNEQLLQKITTTTAADVTVEQGGTVTTTVTESASVKSMNKLTKFVFDDLDLNKAEVLPDEENDAIYVVIRADLRERMTEDDLWSEDYIKSLQQLRYSEDFDNYMTDISKSYSIDKKSYAYRRYSPFDKLLLETSSAASN